MKSEQIKLSLASLGITSDLYLDPVWLDKLGVSSTDFVVFSYMEGNYMEPTIKEDSLMMISTDDKSISAHPNAIFLYEERGRRQLRRLFKSPSHAIRSSFDMYPAQAKTLSNFDFCISKRLIGRVVWAGQEDEINITTPLLEPPRHPVRLI